MANEHPDALAIDLVRTGEGSPADQAHVENCADCRRVVAELEDLAADLRAVRVPIEIPDEVDQRIAWNARKRAAEIRRRPARRGTIRQYGWAAAAAVLLAIGGVGVWQRTDGPASQVALGDIDADGRVDMLDALALARVVERGGSLDPSWDLNADGKVDARDAAAVARRAVQIEGA